MVTTPTFPTAVTREKVLELLQEVKDPEIPVVSLVELGMVGDIHVHDGTVTVQLIPTYSACPALNYIKRMVESKFIEEGITANILVDRLHPWSAERITSEGRRKIESFGLGIPAEQGNEFSIAEFENSKCPHCHSTNTTMQSIFGSSLCRSIHYCFDCRQSFERFKPM